MTTTLKIEACDGLVRFRCDPRVFIGTTGDEVFGTFPGVGTPLHLFEFAPKEEENGTLVFDYQDTSLRTPLSPLCLHYWSLNGKVVADEGFDSRRMKKYVNKNVAWGYVHPVRKSEGVPRTYYTGGNYPVNSRGVRVGLVDLLRFLEGKIEQRQLDTLVIND